MRLIDADELKKMFPDKGEGSWTYNITAKAYIDAQPAVDQWHYPSKGELPPNGGDYLVYIKYEDREYIRVGQYFGETGWYTDLGEVYGYWTPIAWMPLPEPPKEEV